MGLLDGIASAVMGKVMGGENGNMAQIAMDLLNQNGGLSGVLEKFNQGGLADQVSSWVGKGENMPISAEQISAVLGNGQVAEIASKFGVNPETLSAQIAEHLPSLVDKLTPDGTLPANEGNLLSTVLGMLK